MGYRRGCRCVTPESRSSGARRVGRRAIAETALACKVPTFYGLAAAHTTGNLPRPPGDRRRPDGHSGTTLREVADRQRWSACDREHPVPAAPTRPNVGPARQTVRTARTGPPTNGDSSHRPIHSGIIGPNGNGTFVPFPGRHSSNSESNPGEDAELTVPDTSFCRAPGTAPRLRCRGSGQLRRVD